MSAQVFPEFDFELDLPAALIVIDMQVSGTSPDAGLGRAIERTEPGFTDYLSTRVRTQAVPAIRDLQQAFHDAGQPVVFMLFGSDRGDGSDVPTSTIRYRDDARKALTGSSVILPRTDPTTNVLPEIPVTEHDIVMSKMTMDSFPSTDLHRVLQDRGVKSVVVTGVYTDACVESTSRSAAELGYRVFVPEDACAAWQPEFHAASLANLSRYFARVTDSTWVTDQMRQGKKSA